MNTLDDRLRAYFAAVHFDLDPGLPGRALHAVRGRQDSSLRRPLALAPALAAVLVAALTGTTLAWASGAASLTDQMLRELGLTRAERAQVESGRVLAQVTAAGRTIRILSVYADEQHTVVVVDVQGKPGLTRVEATDNLGRTQDVYEEASAAGSSEFVLFLGPLSPGASRLTLTAGPLALTVPVHIVSASLWSVHPAAGQLGPLAVTDVAATGDSGLLMVDITMHRGPLTPGSLGDLPTLRVLGPDGQPLHRAGPGLTAGPGVGGEGGAMDRRASYYFQSAGSGTYRVLIDFQGHHMESTFTIR